MLLLCAIPPKIEGELLERVRRLSDEERLKKAGRLPPEKQAQSLVAGLLGQYGLLRAGAPSCRFLSGEDGQPRAFAKGYFLSLSHSGGAAACAVERSPVGVDVERVSAAVSRRLIERVCSAAEARSVFAAPDPCREFYRHWVLKESYYKASEGCKAVTQGEFFLEGDRISGPPGYRFSLYEGLEGYLAALCVREAGQG